MRLSLSFIAAAAFAGMTAQSALAVDLPDGVTFSELQAALEVGFAVQAAETDKGNKFLVAKGKNHIIAAQLLQCGADSRCDGVRYFSILTVKPSDTAINTFNNGPNYSKISVSDSGTAIISLDHYVGGGVTSENVLRTGAVLMAGMTKLGLQSDIIASNKSWGNAALASFDRATAEEALSRPFANVNFSIQPALAQAFVAHVEKSAR